jgi:hypothetical protein
MTRDFDYVWEEIRDISEDLKLDCNFHLDVFPALLKSKDRGTMLVSCAELYKLMEEIADRFGKKIVDK